MDFAVVKFTSVVEDNSEVVVSEVPSSWLNEDNTRCKWPPEKYAAIYISKKFAPQEDWLEYPVEVERFCGTLAEAREVAKGTEDNKVGRGHRVAKPTDYFSPAEEEEKARAKDKKINFKKNVSPASFVSLMTDSSDHNIIQSNETSLHLLDYPVDINQIETNQAKDPIIEDEEAGSSKGSFASHSLVLEKDLSSVHAKLDKVLLFIADLKIDIEDLRKRLPDTNKKEDILLEFSKPLPFQTLAELEALNTDMDDEEERKRFIKFLKSVGGNDGKDFTYRCLKTLLTDTLAETCSWTGRKNNFEIGQLQLFKILFRVINQKTAVTQKEFETYVAEWLRHAKQRKERILKKK